MILLDSDHLTALRYADHPRCQALKQRLDSAEDRRIATTVISFEEQMRGWLAELSRRRDLALHVSAYDRLLELMTFFKDWEIVRFDERAAQECQRLRKQIRIGTQDLKIAAIALVHDALLLSANLRDFQQVPNLRVEDWIVEK